MKKIALTVVVSLIMAMVGCKVTKTSGRPEVQFLTVPQPYQVTNTKEVITHHTVPVILPIPPASSKFVDSALNEGAKITESRYHEILDTLNAHQVSQRKWNADIMIWLAGRALKSDSMRHVLVKNEAKLNALKISSAGQVQDMKETKQAVKMIFIDIPTVLYFIVLSIYLTIVIRVRTKRHQHAVL